MCVLPNFSFPVQIPDFKLNPSLYTPMSLWSLPNGLLFTSNFPSVLAPIISVLPGRTGGGCTRKVNCTKLGRGVDFNGLVCDGVHDRISERDIYFFSSNPYSNAQYSSRFFKGTWE